jgi:hypothetical protein
MSKQGLSWLVPNETLTHYWHYCIEITGNLNDLYLLHPEKASFFRQFCSILIYLSFFVMERAAFCIVEQAQGGCFHRIYPFHLYD